ncbi:MAG TPA: universal stress protein [Vicinamibacterales bacterium]|nr:universal stress protein [Vicinamibacterales bacterium]HQZ38504.1 universal stress protein [Vicinamibacterales bacterium]
MGTARRVARRQPSSLRPRLSKKTSDRKHNVSALALLVVVDATEASRRTLRYVGRMLANRVGVDCHLAYITPGLPPGLLESGGSELPEREKEIESALRGEQHRWMEKADKKTARIFRPARAILQRAGVAAAHIHTCVSSPFDAGRTVDEVLLLARDQGCGTVVVGHRAHTWFRGLGGGHLAEQLVRIGKGFAIWVVD